ncbi:MAG: SGNH/GDSL hydrolase family protein [Spirochaetota bacterium]
MKTTVRFLIILAAAALPIFTATMTYGTAKAVVDGTGGTFDRNGERILEKMEIYLSDKGWNKLFPIGREDWTVHTNGGVLHMTTSSPYAVSVSYTPLSNGIRADIRFDIPPGTDIHYAVIDVFLAKKIFLGCQANIDGTSMLLDPANTTLKLTAETISFAARQPWRLTLRSARTGAWALRSSTGAKWRPEELRTFDALYSIENITTNGLTDACSFEMTADAAADDISALIISGLPPDLSTLAMANVDRFFPSERSVPPFSDGDVVCFIGDSITHRGTYIKYIADFYATRFPDRRVRFINRGIGGDSARNVLKRFDWDIATASPAPTASVVMLGMNDSGYDAVYSPASKPDALNAYREKMLATYAVDMTNVFDRLAAMTGKRIIAFTPTPYEETATHITSKVLTGKDGTLEIFANFVSGLAISRGASIIDMHGAIAHINATAQKSVGGAFTAIGNDRVHPDEVGNLVMAYCFLKAQRVPSTVSAVTIDAKSKKLTSFDRCAVSDLSFTGKGVSFSMFAGALPFPVETMARTALRIVPFTDDCNREILCIKGLPSGSYALSIDTLPVGAFTAAELDRGINLALFETPQMLQARDVARVNAKRHALETDMRWAAYIEAILRQNGVDTTDAESVKKYVESPAGKSRVTAYIAKYNAVRPKAAAYESDIAALFDEVYTVNKPKKRQYVIESQ